MLEPKIYGINFTETEVEHPNGLNDEEFMKLAEEQGYVWTMRGFETAFNSEIVSCHTFFIRTINVITTDHINDLGMIAAILSDHLFVKLYEFANLGYIETAATISRWAQDFAQATKDTDWETVVMEGDTNFPGCCCFDDCIMYFGDQKMKAMDYKAESVNVIKYKGKAALYAPDAKFNDAEFLKHLKDGTYQEGTRYLFSIDEQIGVRADCETFDLGIYTEEDTIGEYSYFSEEDVRNDIELAEKHFNVEFIEK